VHDGTAAAAKAMRSSGRLDVLFSNAGIFVPKPFLDVTDADYDLILTIILKGSYFAAQAAKALGRCSGKRGSRRRVPDIACRCDNTLSTRIDFTRSCFCLRLVAPVDHDGPSFGNEATRNLLTNARRTASDDGYLAFKPHTLVLTDVLVD
jgi:hypothetical protein